jgi:hypothetical protein
MIIIIRKKNNNNILEFMQTVKFIHAYLLVIYQLLLNEAGFFQIYL